VTTTTVARGDRFSEGNLRRHVSEWCDGNATEAFEDHLYQRLLAAVDAQLPEGWSHHPATSEVWAPVDTPHEPDDLEAIVQRALDQVLDVESTAGVAVAWGDDTTISLNQFEEFRSTDHDGDLRLGPAIEQVDAEWARLLNVQESLAWIVTYQGVTPDELLQASAGDPNVNGARWFDDLLPAGAHLDERGHLVRQPPAAVKHPPAR
jgi:hypothetical protein